MTETIKDGDGAQLEPWAQEAFNAGEDGSDVDQWSTPAPAGDGERLKPFVDPVVEAELQEGPPAWMGIRWRDIDISDRAEAWTVLRQWVDWFIREYQMDAYAVPACWYEHSNLVAELYAAMCAEYKIWEEGSPGLGAMTTWHPHVQALKGRLLSMTGDHSCSSSPEKTHVPDVVELRWAYNEERWSAVREGGLHTDELPRAGAGRLWRPVTVSKEGEIIAGEPVTVRQGSVVATGPEQATVLSAADTSSVQGRYLVAGPVAETYWEYKGEDSNGWRRHAPAKPETDNR